MTIVLIHGWGVNMFFILLNLEKDYIEENT